MQRRLVEELKDLESNIQSIQDSYKNIYSIIDKLIAAPDKAFEVSFKGIVYDFYHPVTGQEKIEIGNLRRKLLSELFKECFNQMIDGKDTWWMVTAFASGIDTLDMQIEIIGKEEHLNMVDDDGKRIKALPIDESNYQVKQEMEYDTPDQALDI